MTVVMSRRIVTTTRIQSRINDMRDGAGKPDPRTTQNELGMTFKGRQKSTCPPWGCMWIPRKATVE